MAQRETRDEIIRTLHRLGRLSSIFPASAEGPLTKGEFFCIGMLLDYLEKHPEGKGMCVWELAQQMKVSPPGASRMLRGMERKGFIERNVDREDRRNTYIIVKPQGRESWNRTAQQVQDFMDRVVARMGQADMAALIGQWNRFFDIIEDEQAKETGIC